MHKGFRVAKKGKPGNMGKFAKWYKCELLKRAQDQTGGGGSTGSGPRGITEPLNHSKIKKAILLHRDH